MGEDEMFDLHEKVDITVGVNSVKFSMGAHGMY